MIRITGVMSWLTLTYLSSYFKSVLKVKWMCTALLTSSEAFLWKFL